MGSILYTNTFKCVCPVAKDLLASWKAFAFAFNEWETFVLEPSAESWLVLVLLLIFCCPIDLHSCLVTV